MTNENTSVRKIGTDIRDCVTDIVEGRVDIRDVDFIITTQSHFEDPLDVVIQVAPSLDPKIRIEGSKIIVLLWEEGKIFAPTSPRRTGYRLAGATWIDSPTLSQLIRS